MKIIEDNYTKKYEVENTQYELTCDKCKSKLSYEKEDVVNLDYGLPYIQCPLCGNMNEIYNEDWELKLTKDNLVYPKHFSHTSKDTGAVNISDEKINEYIKDYVESMIKNDIDDWSGHVTGDVFISISKDEGDYYNITVANCLYLYI